MTAVVVVLVIRYFFDNRLMSLSIDVNVCACAGLVDVGGVVRGGVRGWC